MLALRRPVSPSVKTFEIVKKARGRFIEHDSRMIVRSVKKSVCQKSAHDALSFCQQAITPRRKRSRQMTDPSPTEKILTATRDAAPVVKGIRYAVKEVGSHHYLVRSLERTAPYTGTFTREVFG
jgi:hypothetical protein